jgi:hypothetical protein
MRQFIMGARANVIVKDEQGHKVYLYTHWYGSELPRMVRNALKRGRGRWDDPPYLTRIIFSEMIKDDLMDTTGFGISSVEGDGGDYPDVIVDISQQKVWFAEQIWTFAQFAELEE